jgi:hypothetical protein
VKDLAAYTDPDRVRSRATPSMIDDTGLRFTFPAARGRTITAARGGSGNLHSGDQWSFRLRSA